MLITPSTWPRDGTALQSSCSGMAAVLTAASASPCSLLTSRLERLLAGLRTGRRWTCGQWAAY